MAVCKYDVRGGHTPAPCRFFQPTELSRELVQSISLERKQNLPAESALERAVTPFGKTFMHFLNAPNPAYPLPSSLLGGREMRRRSDWPREE